MTRIRPLGIRQQLSAAMVALAVLSVAVAGLLIHRAADREVEDCGRRDLQQTADRLAIGGAIQDTEAGGWPAPHVREPVLPERGDDHGVVLLDARGPEVHGSLHEVPPDRRRAPVVLDSAE